MTVWFDRPDATEPEERRIDFLRLEGNVELLSQNGRIPTFSVVAYDGQPMQPTGWPEVVIDLQGLDAGQGNLPVLLDHDSKQRVGHTTAVRVGNTLEVEGSISGTTQPALEVMESARRGFVWRASVGLNVLEHEDLAAGEVAFLNGREVVGPLALVRRSELVELSFLSVAADSHAIVSIAARGGANMSTDTTVETPIEQLRAERAAEIKRLGELDTIFAGRHADLHGRAVMEGWDCTKSELECLRADRAGSPAIHSASKPRLNNSILQASLLTRAGFSELAEKTFEPQTLEAANRLRGMTLMETIRVAAQAEGRLVTSLDDSELLKAGGWSTFDLPTALTEGTQRVAIAAFEAAESSWRPICAVRWSASCRRVIDLLSALRSCHYAAATGTPVGLVRAITARLFCRQKTPSGRPPILPSRTFGHTVCAKVTPLRNRH